MKYLDILECIAAASKDPSTKVGCAIINSKHEVLATGCNNFPKHSDHTKLSWNRPDKYYYIIHAESNALDSLDRGELLDDVTMYITDAPCDVCLKSAINRGIRRIEYGSARLVREKYSTEAKKAIKALIEASNIIVVNYNTGVRYEQDI